MQEKSESLWKCNSVISWFIFCRFRGWSDTKVTLWALASLQTEQKNEVTLTIENVLTEIRPNCGNEQLYVRSSEHLINTNSLVLIHNWIPKLSTFFRFFSSIFIDKHNQTRIIPIDFHTDVAVARWHVHLQRTEMDVGGKLFGFVLERKKEQKELIWSDLRCLVVQRWILQEKNSCK